MTLDEALAVSLKFPGISNYKREHYLFFWNLVRYAAVPGSPLVEIGTYGGRTSVLMALAAPQCPVLTVDEFRPDRGFDVEVVKQGVQAEGLTNLTILKHEIVANDPMDFLPSNISFVFLDAARISAIYEPMLFRLYERLRPGGVILCDDIGELFPHEKPQLPVVDFAVQLLGRAYPATKIAMVHKFNQALIQKP